MAKAMICDLCGKPIEMDKSLTGQGYSKYRVSIRSISEGWTMAGHYKHKTKIDMCVNCMSDFGAFARERGVIDD